MRIPHSGLLVVLAVAACGPVEPPSNQAPAAPRPVAAAFDVGPIRPVAEYLAEPPYADADFERGELLSLACIACHTLHVGEDPMLGPNLGGIIGAAAAVRPGFAYSDALAASGLVWTPAALDAWLAAPAGFVPGTSMVFAGYADASDRRDLIAYLLRETGTTAP
jgi:cytochrome c2